MAKYFFIFVGFVVTCARAQDTSKVKKDSVKVLKTATVARQAPMIQHQLDRIVLNVDHQVTAAGSNVLELLRSLPGIVVAPDGSITLNGRAGVNVMLDGKPTYLSAEDLASLLTGMPSAEVQKVELMTNPPAKYDAEGTGGLINIVRRHNHADGLNGSVTGTGGEGNYPRYAGSALVSYKTRRWNLWVNESYVHSKSVLGRNVRADILNGGSLLTQQVSNSSDFVTNRGSTTTAGTDWYLTPSTSLTVTGNLAVHRYRYVTNSAMNVYNGGLNKTGGVGFSAVNADRPYNYSTGVQLRHVTDTVGGEWSADVDYSEFRYRPGQDNTTVEYDATGKFLDQSEVFLGQTRRLQIVGARVDYVHPWAGGGKREAGGKFEAGWKSSYVRTVNNSSYYDEGGGQRVIDSTQSDYNLTTEAINAAYVNVERHHGHLSVQGGLRGEQTLMNGQQLYTSQAEVRQRYFELFPTLFAGYKVDSRNSVNLQLGRRIDRADYHELVPFRRPLTSTLFFAGNPYLRPTLTWHGEATWAWRNALYITLSYDIDKDYVRTFPYLDANDSTLTRRPTNVQGAHSWDAVVAYNHVVTRWWTTNTSVEVYRNAFTGNAGEFSLDNAGIVSLDFSTNNSFTISNGLSGEIDFETETKRQFVQSTYGAYEVLSFGLRQQLWGKKVAITLNAHNVLQGDGRSSVDRYLNFNQYSYAQTYSRAVTLTVNYTFGKGKAIQAKIRSGSGEEQERAGN